MPRPRLDEPSSPVRVEWKGRALVVTIDRPHRRNAVDLTSLLLLRSAQDMAEQGDARAVVLTGAPPAFCAGADLTGVEGDAFRAALADALAGFVRLSMPVIAAIDGPALGAGTQLAIVSDLRVATPESVFGIPAAKLGLAVDQFTVERLAREMGWPIARAMLMVAETYTAAQLHASGAVHRLGGLDVALEWADEISRRAPLTIAAHKLALEHGAGAPAVHELVESARAAAWASADAREGQRAFHEKRAPDFRGR